MRMMSVASVVGLFVGLAVPGCGSSGGTCGNTAACGGAIAGTWTITSSCVSESASMVDSQCPSATASSSALTITGSITYNADGTYSSTSTVSGSIEVTLPPSCLTMNGVTLTCDQLNQLSQANPTAGVTLNCRDPELRLHGDDCQSDEHRDGDVHHDGRGAPDRDADRRDNQSKRLLREGHDDDPVSPRWIDHDGSKCIGHHHPDQELSALSIAQRPPGGRLAVAATSRR